MNVRIVKAAVAELIREVVRNLWHSAMTGCRADGDDVAVDFQCGFLVVGGVVGAA